MSEMSPAEEVFFAALEKATPAGRAAYLDEACAGQPELRARVEKLLAAHPRVGDFLEPVAVEETTGTYAADNPSVTSDLPTPAPARSSPESTSSCSRSAKAAWVPSGWPIRPSR